MFIIYAPGHRFLISRYVPAQDLFVYRGGTTIVGLSDVERRESIGLDVPGKNPGNPSWTHFRAADNFNESMYRVSEFKYVVSADGRSLTLTLQNLHTGTRNPQTAVTGARPITCVAAPEAVETMQRILSTVPYELWAAAGGPAKEARSAVASAKPKKAPDPQWNMDESKLGQSELALYLLNKLKHCQGSSPSAWVAWERMVDRGFQLKAEGSPAANIQFQIAIKNLRQALDANNCG